jgi:ATPase subunit of ABC transporter with duplicated ATPase domains
VKGSLRKCGRLVPSRWRRFSASAAKAKQAQSRVKRLAKMANTEAVRAEREVRIDFPAPLRLPHALLRLNHATTTKHHML